MIVIADTTPINYLTLIGEIGLLPALYKEIVLPHGVLLGRGEREAILLAIEMAPAVVLTDDREARGIAAMYSEATISTLRVLADAAEIDEVSLEEAFRKLRGTSFRVNEETLQMFLSEDAIRRKTDIP